MKAKYVVGTTTPQEVLVASPFDDLKLDEYVVIEDQVHGNLVAEVISIRAYPKVTESTFSKESCIYDSLEEVGHNGALYLASVKVVEELSHPITPMSEVRKVRFDELSQHLVKRMPDKGLVLGAYRGTGHLQDQLPEELSDVAPMYDGDIVPQAGVPLVFDFYKMQEYPHIGLFGNSGSGKTFGMRVIAEELMQKGMPGILLDPHYEFDFSRAVNGFGRDFTRHYATFEIGRDVGIDFTEITTAELINLCYFIADLSPQMEGALEELHETNDSFITLTNRLNRLTEMFEDYERPPHLRQEWDDDSAVFFERYRTKIAGSSTLRALSWRLGLLQKTGIFKEGIIRIEEALLKRKFCVIRGKGKMLSMFSAFLIRKCYAKRRTFRDFEQRMLGQKNNMNIPDKFPPFFVMMDEAHNFAPKEARTPLKSLLKEIAQEARKYGVFLILGTQSPSFLDKVIASQMNTKIIFRINEQADMMMMRTETNLNELQASRLPDLQTGNAFISSPILGKTMSMRFRCTKTLSPHKAHPFDELESFGSDDQLEEVLLSFLPIKKEELPKKHSAIQKQFGKHLTIEQIVDALEAMAVAGKLEKDDGFLGMDRYYPL